MSESEWSDSPRNVLVIQGGTAYILRKYITAPIPWPRYFELTVPLPVNDAFLRIFSNVLVVRQLLDYVPKSDENDTRWPLPYRPCRTASSTKLRRFFGETPSALRRRSVAPSAISQYDFAENPNCWCWNWREKPFFEFPRLLLSPVSCLFRTKQLVSQMLKYCHFIGQLLRHKTASSVLP